MSFLPGQWLGIGQRVGWVGYAVGLGVMEKREGKQERDRIMGESSVEKAEMGCCLGICCSQALGPTTLGLAHILSTSSVLRDWRRESVPVCAHLSPRDHECAV